MLTTSGNELAKVDLPSTGYCQYCGMAGAHVKLFRPEGLPGAMTFRARAFYVCRVDHFESAVREESRAEIHEQCEADPRFSSSEPKIEWKVMDRYCWSCGTHGPIFKSMTRCSKCGELQRLYIRPDEASPS